MLELLVSSLVTDSSEEYVFGDTGAAELCEAARAAEVGCLSACNDGQAGGRLKKTIPEHSAVSLLQALMTVRSAAQS